MILHMLIAMVAGWMQDHQQQVIQLNWLRVLRSAEASRLGQGGRPQLPTRVVRSEKCVVLHGRV